MTVVMSVELLLSAGLTFAPSVRGHYRACVRRYNMEMSLNVASVRSKKSLAVLERLSK